MSQFSCDVCSFEGIGSTLWAFQNRWFQDCSSLAGAMGEQKDRGEVPHSQFSPFAGVRVPAPEPVVQDFRPESGPGCSDSGQPFEDDYDNDYYDDDDDEDEGDNDNDEDEDNNDNDEDHDDDGHHLTAVVDLCGKEAKFCRVGKCGYWHTSGKQVRRHRISHFSDCFGYLCPNQTGTCPSKVREFRRRDGVNAHCKTSSVCGIALQAGEGKILLRGTPQIPKDLEPYDPIFHKPYQSWDGRRKRRQ